MISSPGQSIPNARCTFRNSAPRVRAQSRAGSGVSVSLGVMEHPVQLLSNMSRRESLWPGKTRARRRCCGPGHGPVAERNPYTGDRKNRVSGRSRARPGNRRSDRNVASTGALAQINPRTACWPSVQYHSLHVRKYSTSQGCPRPRRGCLALGTELGAKVVPHAGRPLEAPP